MYDPTIVRWMSTDPLAEKYYPVGPYVYCAGNPVNVIDIDGGMVDSSNWKPDERGNLIAEHGDDANTLSAFLNISQTYARHMIKSQNLATEMQNGMVRVREGEF